MADPLKEIKEALDWLAILARPVIGARPNSPADRQSKDAARILAHIDRQREEKDKLLNALIDCGVNAGGYGLDDSITVEVPKAVASLSSQLANERFEHRVTADSCEDLIAQRNSAESSLERLKAEQLTAEEAQYLLDDGSITHEDGCLFWVADDNNKCDCIKGKIHSKLRRLSHSDTGDTNG